jgi:hypothetical protein
LDSAAGDAQRFRTSETASALTRFCGLARMRTKDVVFNGSCGEPLANPEGVPERPEDGENRADAGHNWGYSEHDSSGHAADQNDSPDKLSGVEQSTMVTRRCAYQT